MRSMRSSTLQWGCARAPSWTAAAPQPRPPECMPCSLVCDRGCVRGRGDSTCERDGQREGEKAYCDDGSDRCTHGTAPRDPPLCHRHGMEKGSRGLERRETAQHIHVGRQDQG